MTPLRFMLLICCVLLGSGGLACAQFPLTPDVIQSELHETGTARARLVFWHHLRAQTDIQDKLAKPASLPAMAKEVTLAGLLAPLAERNDVTLVIDTNAFARAGIQQVDQFPLKPFPKLKKPTVRQVLDSVLSQLPATAGATFMIRRDYIEITTQQEIDQVMLRRWLRLRSQLLEELPGCASWDTAGTLFWSALGDLLGHNLTD
jgi:hypothetical protein